MITLDDACLELMDCVNRTAPEDPNGNFFAVGTPAMRGNVINFGEARRLDEATFRTWTRRLVPREDDLLLAREAPVGPVVRIPAGGNIAAGQRTTHLRADPNVVDPQFLYFYLIAPETQARLLARAMGSTVPHLRVADVKAFELEGLPPRVEQQGIAEVLGALDDKIVANRRVLAASDELIRLRYARLAISASAKLGTIAGSVRQQVGSGRIAAEATYVGLEHFERERLWLERFGVGSDVTSAKSTFQAGDTLFGKLRPYFHKVSIAPAAGVCSTDVLVIRAVDEEHRWLVAAAASSDTAVARAVQNSNGTRMPRAKWEDIADLAVPDPASSEARVFEHLAASLGRRCFTAVDENEVLAKTRDELLPLLMSGRITVKDAEKTVEEVV